jgi:hypothetical protein
MHVARDASPLAGRGKGFPLAGRGKGKKAPGSWSEEEEEEPVVLVSPSLSLSFSFSLYWSYWSFNEHSTSATPVACPWTSLFFGALVLCIKPTSSLPEPQFPT